MERPSKRARVSPDSDSAQAATVPSVIASTPLASLHRSITPPSSRARSRQPTESISTTAESQPNKQSEPQAKEKSSSRTNISHHPRLIPSPIQLTHIQDFPSNKGYNVDTIHLRDILGDPMIRECWQFNYCFDVDFLMAQFDQDVRRLVQVKVVHGSWEKESANRVRIDEACARYPNVEAIVAYMPERFGTHHSKMMILLRHDDLAQVVIHTANMLSGDWTNMTQAVWRSPLLPLQRPDSPSSNAQAGIGSSLRFKRDLLAYLNVYGTKKTGSLVQQLQRYDFGAVRAALIASVPSKQQTSNLDSDKSTVWGWPALKDLMSRVPVQRQHQTSASGGNGHIVIQVSSVATLGQTGKWLKDVFFTALSPTPRGPRPKYSIIFPTPDEIRRSLDGYMSGGSIHMKTQTATQQKQLQYLRPYLCHWAGDSLPDESGYIDLTTEKEEKHPKREAGRSRAAPHIKTYISYSDAEKMDRIDWAMVTSANLSTQAWGAATNASGEVRISSWEIGVVVWPDLFIDAHSSSSSSSVGISRVSKEQEPGAVMVPCFKHDQPSTLAPPSESLMSSGHQEPSVVVGFRMPYDLPLTPYRRGDEPWSATASHYEPDWCGQRWVD